MSEPVQDINSKTVGGTLIYCDWMIRGGYGTPSRVNPWKIAIKKVFETLEGEDYESFNWADLDLDEYLDRFQRIAGANYKAESIFAYGRRVDPELAPEVLREATPTAPNGSAGPRLAG